MGATGGSLIAGLVVGVFGAVAGTLGGYECRVRLVKATGGNDLPIALLEDAIAIGGAFLIVSRFGDAHARQWNCCLGGQFQALQLRMSR